MTILVPDGENNLSSIVGAYKIFSRANAYRKQEFRIELAGISAEVDFYGGLFTAKPHKHIADVRKTDLIIIPSLNHNYEKTTTVNSELIEWVGTQYRQGAAVASFCTGAYLLAAAGLLDGKSCSTHWSAADRLKQLHPKVI